MFGATAVLLAGLLVGAEQSSAEKVFRENADFGVGGVWTSTDAKGGVHEGRREWILNKAFLLSTWTIYGDKGVNIFGMDPVTGKVTGWSFDNKGHVGKGTNVFAKPGEIIYVEKGQGPKGPYSWRERNTKIGPDESRQEIQENVLDGKPSTPPETMISNRKNSNLSALAAIRSDKADPGPDNKAFKEWGDFMVGGTWSGPYAKGGVQDDHFEWILNKTFLLDRWVAHGDSGISVIGIDPATGKLSTWSFDEKGRVGKGEILLQKEGNFVWSEKGQGKEGPSSWKSLNVKLGPDTIREDVENTVDGKTLLPETITQIRKKK